MKHLPKMPPLSGKRYRRQRHLNRRFEKKEKQDICIFNIISVVILIATNTFSVFWMISSNTQKNCHTCDDPDIYQLTDLLMIILNSGFHIFIFIEKIFNNKWFVSAYFIYDILHVICISIYMKSPCNSECSYTLQILSLVFLTMQMLMIMIRTIKKLAE